MTDAIHYLPLATCASLLQAREVSPLQLTEHMLARIESLDPRLKSYATVMADEAMANARQAEQEIESGNYRGPLHGVPVAVKDLCFTAGVPTMGGLKVRRGFRPDFDATVVQRLNDAGAIILGKLNLTEGALSAYNPDFPIPVNPWGESLWAGVSSSGSGVAIAAGLCFAAIGTDTGGSIRYPAMANGIVGLKPSYGRVSRHGVMELAGSLDHVGPMTRTVEDAAIFFETIAGPDPLDNSSSQAPIPDISAALHQGIEDLTIGVDWRYIETGTDPGLVDAIRAALDVFEELGVRTIELSMPHCDPMALRDLWLPITGYEAARAHADTFPARAEEYGGYLRQVLEQGLEQSEEDYLAALARREAFSREFTAALAPVDGVICPAGGFVFEVDRQAQYGDTQAMRGVIQHFQGQFTIPADLAGTPGLVVPCGFAPDGRPYTLQLLGSSLGELELCRLGHAYQCATDWQLHHPPC